MSNNDQARNSNPTKPNDQQVHEDESRRDPDPRGEERRKPGGPHFPSTEPPDPEPEKSGVNNR